MTDDPAQAIHNALAAAELLSAPEQDDEVDGGDDSGSEHLGADDLAALDTGGDQHGPPIPEALLRECSLLDQNDTDNGQRLLKHFRDDILFVREIGWHAWAGTHWEVEGGGEKVEKFAQETARRIKLELPYIEPSKADKDLIEAAEAMSGRMPEELTEGEKASMSAAEQARSRLGKRRADRRKFAISSGNRSRTVAMIAQAIPHRTVAPSALDAHPRLFNVQNGTLVFKRRAKLVDDPECPDPEASRKIEKVEVSIALRKPHDRADLIAKVAPITFVKGAVAKRWLAFLERFQPDEAQRRYLQAAAGRALLGGASTQVLIFLYGDGANGKSVFMETLAQVLGAYAGRLKPESITGAMEQSGDKATPDFARLTGKRFVAIAELPRGAPLREGLIKTMTGSEPMPVRHLNHGFFDLLPEFIPFMSGNQMPQVSGLDRGIWRRLKFVEWPVSIPEAEQKALPAVVAEHLEESSGLLNWLIEGARIFLSEGLVDPPSVKAMGEGQQRNADPVGDFLRNCVVPAPGQRVQCRTMYQAFLAFCAANAIPPWKERSFSDALRSKKYEREDKRLRHWLNVALEGVPEIPDEDPRSPSESDVVI